MMVNTLDTNHSGPEFDSPRITKKSLEPASSPFKPEEYTWDPRKKCTVDPDPKNFFGMGLSRRCARCERLRDRETNLQFRDWELDQFDKWVAGRSPPKAFDL